MASVRKRAWTHNGEKRSAWQLSYTDNMGKRRTQTFEKKKDADSRLIVVQGEIAKGQHVASGATVKFRVLCEQYDSSLVARVTNKNIGQTHLNQIRRMLRIHFLPTLGETLVTAIRHGTIEDLVRGMHEKGHQPRTIGKALFYARRAMDFGVSRRYLSRNVIAEVMAERGNISAPGTIGTFTPDQIGQILAVLEGPKPWRHQQRAWDRLKLWVRISAFSGLRMGEIAALPRSAIDVKNRVISVRQNLTQLGELKGPKTKAGIRDVPMPALVAEMLDKWIGTHFVANEDDLLFFPPGMRRSDFEGNFRRAWIALLRLAGIKPHPEKGEYHFHALRHFAATFMLEHGLPLMETAHVLGHSKPSTTMQVYAHAVVKMDRQAATMEKMAAALVPLIALERDKDATRAG